MVNAPGLVEVFDAGETGNTYHYARASSGRSLKQRCR